MPSTIKKLSWNDVRESTYESNSEMAEVIDNLPLKDEHCLFSVRYPYGAHFLLNGAFLVPNSRGELVPLHDSSLDPAVKDAFRLNRFFPIYFCTHNHIEVYFDYPGSNVPVSMLSPGRLTGLYDLDDTFSSVIPHAWNWHSGAKSTVLICGEHQEQIGKKICNELSLSYKDIVKYGHIDLSCILSKLVSNNLFNSNEWYSEILLFSSNWCVNQNNNAWRPFYDYIKQISWDRTKLWRYRWIWDGLLARCINGNESQLTVALAKHFISLACGSLTGYTHASEVDLPLESFNAFYKDLFNNSDEYKILSPSKFNAKDSSSSIYCPLQPDMLLDYVPVDLEKHDLTAEKVNLESLLVNFFNQLDEIDLLENTPLYNIKNKVEFIFDHKKEAFFNQNYVVLQVR